jgi:hypothetical protein
MIRRKKPAKPIQLVLGLLEGVRESSQGYTALCPAHADINNSLSVAEGKDGRVLIHCFAGCEITDIVAALGIELSDLFPRNRTKNPREGAKHGPHR